jgi:hypothetical protein
MLEPVLTVRYSVTAYDAAYGGYGDDRSREFGNEQDAIAYARDCPDNYNASVWKTITMQPIVTHIPHTPSPAAGEM